MTLDAFGIHRLSASTFASKWAGRFSPSVRNVGHFTMRGGIGRCRSGGCDSGRSTGSRRADFAAFLHINPALHIVVGRRA
ncbi:hypothetical protein [Burkholderia oklahomensis]|uniref:hypothetical protein n=1 Tax=Burkholderia oklahomensis TaxID=342113 RepID=UPI000F53179F|nr:hypothetical protein [Burkholderia oklahomensis]MBI0363839.1 hypothetical protein [Burkholderia oklahomensis]